MSADLENALLELLKSGQGITLNVVLTPSEKVLSLERQIKALQEEAKRMEREIFDVHRRYREAVIINERLFQWMGERGIDFPEQDTHRSMLYFKAVDPKEWK